MEEKKRPIKKWLYWFLFTVAVLFVYKTLDNFSAISVWFSNLLSVLSPFLMGILIAYLLYTPCKKIENAFLKSKKLKKRARGLSIITVYIMAVLLLVIIFNVLIPVIANSVIDLVSNFQNYYNITLSNFEALPENSILKSDIVRELFNNLKNIDFREFINIEKIAEYAKGAISVAGKIVDFFIAIVVSIYILLQRTEILKFARNFCKVTFKKDTYNNIRKYFNKTNEVFFNFLAGQLLDAVVVGVITSIAMSIIGVKYAVLLGFMIGLFNLIPYFGAIVAVVIAAIITLLTGGLTQAITLVIVTTVLQQIDANIINPKIMSASLKISPLLVIFSVSIGGAYFGVLGMFLGVPIITVIKVILTDYVDHKNQLKEIEDGDEE